MTWVLILAGLVLFQPEAKDYPGAAAIYSLDSTRVTVKEDFGKEASCQVIMRIFNPRGRDRYSNFMQRYDKSTEELKLILAETHTIKDDGSRIEVSKEKGIGDLSTVGSTIAPAYSDARIKTCAFGGVEPGDVIKYTSAKLTKPPGKRALFGRVPFASDEPILRKVFILELPEKVQIGFKVIGEIEVDTARIGSRSACKFSADSIPRMRHEQHMLPIAAFGPGVLYTTFGTWDEVGAWLRDKFEPSMETKGELAKKAKELGDPEKICQFVASGWRDITIGFEDIGFEPTRTRAIYKNKYGSPLDKVALLVAMLRSIGEEAYPAYIARAGVEKDIPAPLYFDDVVVAIPEREGFGFLDPVFPERGLFPPTVSHIILRKESSYALPFDRGSGICFIVMKDAAFFYQMPAEPSESRVGAELTLAQDGTLAGRMTGRLTGIDAAYARMYLRGKREKELKQTFEGYAARIGLDTELRSWKVSGLDSILPPVYLELQFKTAGYLIEQAGEYRFPLPPNPFGFAPRASYFGQEDREFPFTSLSPHSTRFQVEVQLPEEFAVRYLPEGFSHEDNLVGAGRVFTCEGGLLTCDSVWRLKKGVYEPVDYKGLEDVYAEFVSPKRGFVIFRRR